MSDTLNPKLVRTWIQALLETGHREVAALLLDGEFYCYSYNFSPSIVVELPTSAFTIVTQDNNIQEVIESSLMFVARGHITDQNGNGLARQDISYRVKLMEPEEDWRAVVRTLIVNSKLGNQALVTSTVAERKGRAPLVYNEMRFASKAEVRIAQELEQRGILFLPLPLMVRAETGQMYKDHREPDFLICVDGLWGILEVAYHPNRYEQDAEKAAWYKKSGILCVEHFTSERCWSNSAGVVEQFLSTLKKHRR